MSFRGAPKGANPESSSVACIWIPDRRFAASGMTAMIEQPAHGSKKPAARQGGLLFGTSEDAAS
jgi:hypothetical protein